MTVKGCGPPSIGPDVLSMESSLLPVAVSWRVLGHHRVVVYTNSVTHATHALCLHLVTYVTHTLCLHLDTYATYTRYSHLVTHITHTLCLHLDTYATYTRYSHLVTHITHALCLHLVTYATYSQYPHLVTDVTQSVYTWSRTLHRVSTPGHIHYTECLHLVTYVTQSVYTWSHTLHRVSTPGHRRTHALCLHLATDVTHALCLHLVRYLTYIVTLCSIHPVFTPCDMRNARFVSAPGHITECLHQVTVVTHVLCLHLFIYVTQSVYT